MARHPSTYSRWQDYSSARVPELVAEGLENDDALRRAGEEWRSREKTSRDEPKRAKRTSKGASMSSRKKGLTIEYIRQVDGALSEEQAADIALGLLDGLLEYADADYSEEYRVMQRRAAELFRGPDKSDDDTAERKFGADLAEFLILAVIDRAVSWDQLEPAVLSGGSRGSQQMPDFGAPAQGPPAELTAEQELGLAPRPETSRRSRIGGTAVQATVRALEQIIQE